MRKQTSLFNRACVFINSIDDGANYKTKQYIAYCRPYEGEATSWKKKHPTYRSSQYQGYLKRAGFIQHVKRGEWKVIKHVPEWFDLGHLSILLGYHKRDTENRCDIKTYKGMDREDIVGRLSEIPWNKYASPAISSVTGTARELAKSISEICDTIGKTRAAITKPAVGQAVSTSYGVTKLSYKNASPTNAKSVVTLEAIMAKLDSIALKVEWLEANVKTKKGSKKVF